MDAYLSRIGATRGSTLTELHERHLLTVPFENLDIHLGVRILLDTDALLDKIVTRRRGGFCYELNGAFAALLRSLGHDVKLLAARVFTPKGLTPPFDHMALLVDDEWLADVGFGRFTLHPLRWDSREDQTDPAGVFRLVDTADGDVEVVMDGEPQYRLDVRPRELAEFGPTCWWQQTAPESHFLQGPVVTLATSGGRITLAGAKLIRTAGESKTEEQVSDVLETYRSLFGFSLPHADFRQSNAAGFLPFLPV